MFASYLSSAAKKNIEQPDPRSLYANTRAFVQFLLRIKFSTRSFFSRLGADSVLDTL